MNNEIQQPLKTVNKYWVLLIVCSGTILSSYVSNAVNIALPNILQNFQLNMHSIVWVSLGYLLPYSATLPLMGKLGDQFGRKKMYIWGLIIFTMATLFVGLAWSGAVLIVFRIIQGIGGGLLYPNAMALVADNFPDQERGQALGIWGAVAAGGSALGPTLGGFLLEYASWNWIFYLLVPFGVLTIFLAYRILPQDRIGQKFIHVDYAGGVVLIFSLSSFLLALNQGNQVGWQSVYILGLFSVAVVGMFIFGLIECQSKSPLVEFSLFRNINFSIGNFVGFIVFFSLYAAMYLLPFFLQHILVYSSMEAGIAMLPFMLTILLLAPLGGKLSDLWGEKLPILLGILMIAASLYGLSDLNQTTDSTGLTGMLILLGAGFGITSAPLSSSVMSVLPIDKIGLGAGVYNLFRNIGGSMGVSLMGMLLTRRYMLHLDSFTQNTGQVAGYEQQAYVLAYDDVFLFTAFFCLLGAVIALFLQKKKEKKKLF